MVAGKVKCEKKTKRHRREERAREKEIETHLLYKQLRSTCRRWKWKRYATGGRRNALDIVSTAFTFRRLSFFALSVRYLGLFTFTTSISFLPMPFSFSFVLPTLSSVRSYRRSLIRWPATLLHLWSFLLLRPARSRETEQQLRSLWTQLRCIRRACERSRAQSTSRTWNVLLNGAVQFKSEGSKSRSIAREIPRAIADPRKRVRVCFCARIRKL